MSPNVGREEGLEIMGAAAAVVAVVAAQEVLPAFLICHHFRPPVSNMAFEGPEVAAEARAAPGHQVVEQAEKAAAGRSVWLLWTRTPAQSQFTTTSLPALTAAMVAAVATAALASPAVLAARAENTL